MKLSAERIQRKARELGFESRYLAKVDRLLSVLKNIREHERLSDELVLKGGTAINLFHFQLPRLSVDLDFNYVGEQDVERMKEKRPRIIQALEAVFERADLSISNDPDYEEHAGITWQLNYHSDIVGRDNIKVDLNFLMRTPLFPKREQDLNQLRDFEPISFWTFDLHELTGGKLRALFQRKASRDLYDAHRLLHDAGFKKERLRIAFVVYGAAAPEDWREITVDDIDYELDELKDQLRPVLRGEEKQSIDDYDEWAEDLMVGCRKGMEQLLPYMDEEIEFLRLVNDRGEIKPELLTNDPDIQENIRNNPGLQWKVLNVRQRNSAD